MLVFHGKSKFRCRQCGHKFDSFYTEGGIKAGPNMPHCPQCGSSDTRKATVLDKIF